MVLYICNINEFKDFCGLSLLTPQRQAEFEGYKRKEDKQRCLVAGLLMDFLLKDKVSEVREGKNGKPYLPDGSVFFNISHSGNYVVLAADNREIGVDVEKFSPVREGVARRCYTDEELSWLNSQSDENAFFTLWTGKESIMKATGMGFSLPPESFSLLPVKDGLHCICGEGWYLNWYPMTGYALCTASKTEEKGELVFLTKEELVKKENSDLESCTGRL